MCICLRRWPPSSVSFTRVCEFARVFTRLVAIQPLKVDKSACGGVCILEADGRKEGRASTYGAKCCTLLLTCTLH